MAGDEDSDSDYDAGIVSKVSSVGAFRAQAPQPVSSIPFGQPFNNSWNPQSLSLSQPYSINAVSSQSLPSESLPTQEFSLQNLGSGTTARPAAPSSLPTVVDVPVIGIDPVDESVIPSHLRESIKRGDIPRFVELFLPEDVESKSSKFRRRRGPLDIEALEVDEDGFDDAENAFIEGEGGAVAAAATAAAGSLSKRKFAKGAPRNLGWVAFGQGRTFDSSWVQDETSTEAIGAILSGTGLSSLEDGDGSMDGTATEDWVHHEVGYTLMDEESLQATDPGRLTLEEELSYHAECIRATAFAPFEQVNWENGIHWDLPATCKESKTIMRIRLGEKMLQQTASCKGSGKTEKIALEQLHREPIVEEDDNPVFRFAVRHENGLPNSLRRHNQRELRIVLHSNSRFLGPNGAVNSADSAEAPTETVVPNSPSVSSYSSESHWGEFSSEKVVQKSDIQETNEKLHGGLEKTMSLLRGLSVTPDRLVDVGLTKEFVLEPSDDWRSHIIWSDDSGLTQDTMKLARMPLLLDMNDPAMTNLRLSKQKLLFGTSGDASRIQVDAPPTQVRASLPSETDQDTVDLDPFNISVDDYYQQRPEGRLTASANPTSTVGIDHTKPGYRLLHVSHVMSDCAAKGLHHPRASFECQRGPQSVLPVQGEKRIATQREMQYPPSAFRSGRSLSVVDSRDDIVLIETAEQDPIFIQNVGMGSRLVHYFRPRGKNPRQGKARQPAAMPPCSEGQVVKLDSATPSPLLVEIPEGEYLTTMETNLYRAPARKAPQNRSDFLLVRTKSKSGLYQLYLKKIDKVFVTGHQEPRVEVPAPNSTYWREFKKNRLEALLLRILNKQQTDEVRLESIKRSMRFYKEDDLRRALKQYGEQIRKERGNYVYVLKESARRSEDEIHSILTPEMVCLYQAVCSSEARLRENCAEAFVDAFRAMDEGWAGYDPGLKALAKYVSDELKVTPWVQSQNFLKAKQDKPEILIQGLGGDSTRRGTGFYFSRASSKPSGNSTLMKQLKSKLLNTSLIKTWDDLTKNDLRLLLQRVCVPDDLIESLDRRERIQMIKKRAASLLPQREKNRIGDEVGVDFFRRLWKGAKTSVKELLESNKKNSELVWNEQQALLAYTPEIEEEEDDDWLKSMMQDDEDQPRDPNNGGVNRAKQMLAQGRAISTGGAHGATTKVIRKICIIRRPDGTWVKKTQVYRDPNLIRVYNKTIELVDREIARKKDRREWAVGTEGEIMRSNIGRQKEIAADKKRRVEVQYKKARAAVESFRDVLPEPVLPGSVEVKPTITLKKEIISVVKEKKTKGKRKSIVEETADYKRQLEPQRKKRKRTRNPDVRLNTIILDIIEQLVEHPRSKEFRHRVKGVKDYRKFVDNPIDFSEMRLRAENSSYPTSAAFLDDLRLMEHNARAYNTGKITANIIEDAVFVRERAEELLQNFADEITGLELRLANPDAATTPLPATPSMSPVPTVETTQSPPAPPSIPINS
eukprot:Rmarinus@m.13471